MKRTLWILSMLAALGAITDLTYRGIGIASVRNSKTTRSTEPPDFTLPDLDGRDVSLGQFKGKVVLINFWATWCGPCRIEIPWFVELQDKYAGRGFTVIGIAMNDEEKAAVAPFVRSERFAVNGVPLPVNYPILLGTDAAAQRFGGLLGVPTSVLISKEGKVVKREDGLINYEELDKAIASQLAH
jgi:cytochrome c biogenesis protein CcmG/thiol:disulfide interchange protein DsbE